MKNTDLNYFESYSDAIMEGVVEGIDLMQIDGKTKSVLLLAVVTKLIGMMIAAELFDDKDDIFTQIRESALLFVQKIKAEEAKQ